MPDSVLITGGSRGIGAAAVRAFSAAGWRVAFLYRASADAAAALSRETGAVALRADVSNPAETARAVRDAERALSRIDALVTCAGVSQFKLYQDITDADWARMIGVNLSGAFYASRAALTGMIARKRGSIVFVGSMWGVAGAAMEAHYAASKAGLHGLAKSLAREVAPCGIRVNCVAPGAVDTDMMAELSGADRAAVLAETPLARFGTPEEIAGLIVYLCSEEGSFFTGQIVSPNGGMVI